MTVATSERYAHMLQSARDDGYAYPAINVTSSQTLNAALQGFAEAESDGIIQVSVGGAAYLSGQVLKNRVVGSLAFAAYAREVASQYPGITVAFHTDHCAQQYLSEWLDPLLDYEIEQISRGQEPAFQSHMWDGSTVSLDKNLEVSQRLLEKSARAHTILEIEVGTVGGEEDGHHAQINEKLYSTPEDALKVAQSLGLSVDGDGSTRYMAAFTFGNVHGAYKPGVVQLRPEILGDIQRSTAAAIASSPGDKPFLLVFHGGSGSHPDEITQAVSHGVVKMNIDTDTQYAFSRAVAGHMFTNYDKVLKVDSEVGEKSEYDPRAWGKEAEDSMAARVVEACVQLGSAGKALR